MAALPQAPAKTLVRQDLKGPWVDPFVAKALDEKVATGALIGAAGGALCDDVGVCQ